MADAALLDTDTIVAIATPPGRGGIGMVRLSGSDAERIGAGLVQLRSPLAPRRVRYGVVLDADGQRVDDALVTLFRAPGSYTGEDVVEIAMHGSPVVLALVVERALAMGARAARAGEFTERAFLRGRLDLTGAEAVRDLIDAQTVQQAKLAAGQAAGALAGQLRPAKQHMVELIATLEAGIDFVEDDLDTMPAVVVRERIASLLPPLQSLLASYTFGRVIREGLRLAIVGRPNAGKSSLFNRLVDRERAIVSAVPGTTRDVVAERISLGGIPLELMDTAGLRESDDEVERIGIERSHHAIAEADLVLVVTDAASDNSSMADEMSSIHAALPQLLRQRPVLLVRNKSDLLPAHARDAGATQDAVLTSALTGQGIDDLRSAILARIGAADLAEAAAAGAVLTNLRQRDHLLTAVEALTRADVAANQGTPHEMILLEMYEALRSLDELTGETTRDDVLQHIFSTFCIGK